MSMRGLVTGLMVAALAAAPGIAEAQQQQRIRIGFISTLTGPSAVLGQHMRDGFQLAVRQMGGRIGGLETEVLVVDDELRPETAVTRVRALIDRDRVDFIAGVVFSNVMMAIHRPIVESQTIFIGTNAGPSPIAGAQCSPFFFSTSYQNDQNHEVMGRYAQDNNFRRVVLITPNYQAGRDALAGFKRHFRGEVLDEIFTQLGQPDYSAELARIASLRPDAVFTFMPGGMGVNLVRQWRQAGLQMPLLSAFTVDETNLPAQQDAAVGMLNGATWAPNMDNPTNRAFVEAFIREFNYVPAVYAAHAFDAARLLDAAVRSLNGNLSDRQATIRAIRNARFDSVRGNFRFGNNQFPIQDFYLTRVERRPDGRFQTAVASRVFEAYQDVYARECRMP